MLTSNLELVLDFHLRHSKLPAYQREHVFHGTRKWRFDFAWPERKLAAEVEGLSSGKSRHQTIKGYRADCEKYNAAVMAGWRVLRFTDKEIKSGEALQMIEEALK